MNWRLVYFLTGVIAIVASCSSPVDSPKVLSLKPYVGRLVSIDAQIGDSNMPMLFDTGAGVTAITPEMVLAIGCAPFGLLVGHRMRGERVDFEKCGKQTITFGEYEAVSDVYVFDLAALLPEGLPALGGIISLASFSDHPFTLDLSRQKLIVETKNSLRDRIETAKQADIRIIKGVGGEGELTILVRIDAEIGDLWFLLDSGNLDHVIVSPHALDQLGIMTGSQSGIVADDVVELDFQITGAYPVSTKARVLDIIYDGVLNEEVMRRFLITFDVENEKLWFSQSK
jgi:hypothetical protein